MFNSAFYRTYPQIRWPLILLVTFILCACGFHLRSSTNLPFNSLYMNFAANSSLGIELKRYIQASGQTQIMPHAENAEVTLDVLSQTNEKVILTLNSSGRPSEYVLYYRLTFRVVNAKKQELLPATTITLKRDISYNTSQELSKTAEEALLYRDMQTDMVQQILRRLAVLKTPNQTKATTP